MGTDAGPHGKISRERVQQIARRKLEALAIPIGLTPAGELEGEILFRSGKIVPPGAGAAIEAGAFMVVSHDRLVLIDPPLSFLGPIPFYDLESAAAMEDRIAQLLKARQAGLEALAEKLRGMKFNVAADPSRLALKLIVKTPQHTFELSGGPDELRVVKAQPFGARPFDVAPSHPAIAAGSFTTAAELEQRLVRDFAAMQPPTGGLPPPPVLAPPPVLSTPDARAPAPAAPAPAPHAGSPDRLTLLEPPTHAMTLGDLVQRLGPHVQVSELSSLELVQEMQVGTARHRLMLIQDKGGLFTGKLIGPNGRVWMDRLQLESFPGVLSTVSAALGQPLEVSPPVEREAGSGSQGEPEPAGPQAGQIWVMDVLIEQKTAEEVRYVCVDPDGRPYGAARVLRRSDFDATFVRFKGTRRLVIRIEEVQKEAVVYRQLDAERQPRGNSKKLATAILATTFAPEPA